MTATSSTSAHLHWVENSTTVSTYLVFDAGTNNLVAAVSPADPTDAYVFNLPQNSLACFTVTAKDPYGNSASTSGCVQLPPTPPILPPSPPTNTYTQVAPDPLGLGDLITFGWQLPPGVISGLRVEREDVGLAVNLVPAPTQQVDEVPYSYEQPVQYCYRVQAFNDGGDSPWTPWVCAETIPLPLEPSNLQLTATPTTVTMTWTDNSAIATAYYVQIGFSSGVVQLPPGATSYTFTGLTPGKLYGCWVDDIYVTGNQGPRKAIRTPLA